MFVSGVAIVMAAIVVVARQIQRGHRHHQILAVYFVGALGALVPGNAACLPAPSSNPTAAMVGSVSGWPVPHSFGGLLFWPFPEFGDNPGVANR